MVMRTQLGGSVQGRGAKSRPRSGRVWTGPSGYQMIAIRRASNPAGSTRKGGAAAALFDSARKLGLGRDLLGGLLGRDFVRG